MLWYRAGDVTIHDVDEARWVLEMHCVDLAARRRTDADLAAIRAPIEAAKDDRLDIADWLDLDVEFHSAITRAAKNSILQLAMMAVHLSRPATNTVHLKYLDRSAVVGQHEAIYDGIARSDPEEAVRAFQGHIDYLDAARLKGLAEMGAQDVPIAQLRHVRALPPERRRADHPT